MKEKNKITDFKNVANDISGADNIIFKAKRLNDKIHRTRAGVNVNADQGEQL